MKIECIYLGEGVMFQLIGTQSQCFLSSKSIVHVHLLMMVQNEILHISSLKCLFTQLALPSANVCP